ncbi:MAG: phosphate signaling complex protein PhoU [Synergistes sp.]|nr:phosphate signaling complex protein PhoU [Synergistes sp.]
MRNRYEEQLDTLNHELTRMGAMCEEAISLAAKGLIEGSEEALRKTSEIEEEIDKEESDIESLCLKLLLRQQPVARDLRQITAALKMISDMERIGDQAADIAELIPSLKGKGEPRHEQIAKMAEAAIKIMTESIEAYIKRDVDLAKATIEHDDIIDAYFDEIKRSLIRLIADSPEEGEYSLDLLMIAKYFERIGDHAVNIAEWVIFSVTGFHKGMTE